jgi:hypothetical protein
VTRHPGGIPAVAGGVAWQPVRAGVTVELDSWDRRAGDDFVARIAMAIRTRRSADPAGPCRGDVEPEAVPGRRADDDIGAELRAGPGDEYLQRLRRVLGPVAGPEPVRQARGARPGAQVGSQEALHARPRDLTPAERHPRQQDQLDIHLSR